MTTQEKNTSILCGYPIPSKMFEDLKARFEQLREFDSFFGGGILSSQHVSDPRYVTDIPHSANLCAVNAQVLGACKSDARLHVEMIFENFEHTPLTLSINLSTGRVAGNYEFHDQLDRVIKKLLVNFFSGISKDLQFKGNGLSIEDCMVA